MSNSDNKQIVKHCPFNMCNVGNIGNNFFCGGAVALLLGAGYWFLRCRK